MKRAPRSRQRHDLYAKYHDYDSEISDLLGECGLIPGTLLDNEFYETANRTKPRLRVRVDDNPIIDIDAILRDDGDNTWVEGRADPGLFQTVQSAKKRVAVVLELLGENYHEKSFAARGSTSAMKRLVAGCGLD